MEFCCDLNAPLPQFVGDVKFSYGNDDGGEYDVEIPVAPAVNYSPPSRKIVSASNPGVYGISANQCGDTAAFFLVTLFWITSNEVHDIRIPIHDRCSVTDPVDQPSGDPALDITAVTTGHTEGGVPWAAVKTAGMWGPPDMLYSWFVSLLLRDVNGAVIADCTHQRHDGVDSTFCDTGDVANLEIRELEYGPVFLFSGGVQATDYSVTAGTAPTPTSNIARDEVMGAMDDAVGDAPGETYSTVPSMP